MENAPIDGLEKLEGHLKVLVDAPETPFDAKLFDDVELQITPSNTLPLLPRLLQPLTTILISTPHDPTIPASLSTKLLSPLNFTSILPLAPPPALTLALSSSPPAALLALAILEKASHSPADAAILASHPQLIAQLIRTWLASPSVAVGDRTTRILAALLKTDCATSTPRRDNTNGSGSEITFPTPATASPASVGQGLLWRRIFGDRAIYSSIFAMCSRTTPADDADHLDERQRSLAQARLLRLLPHLAVLDLSTLSRSPLPEAERAYGGAGKGVLHFAAVEMVDREDVLMHVTLLDFFGELMREVSACVVGAAGEEYLRGLVREAARGDKLVAGMLEAMAGEEKAGDELVELLRRLGITGAEDGGGREA